MRKYIFTSVLITTGVILFLFSILGNNKDEYVENIFSKESKIFDGTFTGFINEFENNVTTIKSNFTEPNKIKDSLFTRNFFLNNFKDNPHIVSIGFFQNNYKIGIKKEKNSVIYAIDSTKLIDIVRWKRFEDGEYISAWDESFENTINNSQQYKDLLKNTDKIQWFFYKNDTQNIDSLKNEDLLYAGYSFKIDTINSVLLFNFSRSALNNDFKNLSKYNDFKIIIENNNGDIWDLSSGKSISQNKNIDIKTDSLSLNILNHFKRFDDKETGIFKFKYNNESFWNSFKKFSDLSGIKNYILTIPNSQLISNSKNDLTKYLKWFALLLISSGLILLLIKKRKFYLPNKINIPTIKDLLKNEESRYLEFKSSSRWDYKQEKFNPELENVIYKTIAAFGNTDGGILLIGIDDDKNILGLEKDFNTFKKNTADFYEIHLRNNLHNLMGVKNVSKNIRIQFEEIEKNKSICKIKVLAANEPVFMKIKNKNGQTEEKFFVRSGNSSQEIKSVIDINDYINTRFNK